MKAVVLSLMMALTLVGCETELTCGEYENEVERAVAEADQSGIDYPNFGIGVRIIAEGPDGYVDSVDDGRLTRPEGC